MKFIYAIFILLPITFYSQGPAQPEFTGFKPVGASENVNLFNGDLNYSVPLMDVEGFPLGLNYLGYVTNTEDASWVGLGWNLNIGSINRQMRGIPDEFNGEDTAYKSFNLRDNKTAGVNLGFNVQLFNWQAAKRNMKLKLGVSLGVFYNNYNGWGHEFGISPSFSLSKSATGSQNGGSSLTAGLGLKSNSQSGLDVTPSLGFQKTSENTQNKEKSMGMSIGAPINSREGLKSINFGMSYTNKTKTTAKNSDGESYTKSSTGVKAESGYSISFASPSYTPTISMPMKNSMWALSINGHGDFFGIDAGGTIMGHMSEHGLAVKSTARPLFGYLFADKGKNNEYAVMDFNREKEMPYHENVPTIAVPNLTYDLFSVNQPDMSGQFRAFRTSSGVVFDSKGENITATNNLGFEIGGGNILQLGITINGTRGTTITKKWNQDNNLFKNLGDFESVDNDVNKVGESFYFKNTNELFSTDMSLFEKMGGNKAVSVALGGSGRSTKAFTNFKDRNNTLSNINGSINSIINSGVERTNQRVSNMSYVLKKEREFLGFEKQIYSYTPGQFGCKAASPYLSPKSKDHHISEVIVTNGDGRRCVYGIPVYNNFQKEVSFAVSENGFAPNPNGLIEYSPQDASVANNRGNDNYYNAETTPAYPHSWLLTSILSPDYQDMTGDGVTDDDMGNAYKFNYTLRNANYKWRNPTTRIPKLANFNIGLQEDDKDDKASYIAGSREEWYIHSIESKNMIAFFDMTEREDAYGVNEHGGLDLSSAKFKLDKIRLYTKAEIIAKGLTNAIPIKVVNFSYDPAYPLCNNIENNKNQGKGKLTLNKVFFTYGTSHRSKFNEYSFKYNNAPYHLKNSDRWGNYKDQSQNFLGMKTEEFPYTLQDTQKSNEFSKAWLLSEIKLPSGSVINMNYEADNYSFVQNKRASFMTQILGFGFSPTDNPSTNLYEGSNGHRNIVFFKLDPNATVPANKEEMRLQYFSDPNNLDYGKFIYFRSKVDIFSQNTEKEYVPGYFEVDNDDFGIKDATTGWIRVKGLDDEGYNPVSFAAWQLAKSQMSKKAYPWSTLGDDMGAMSFIMAIPSFINNLKEMLQGYGTIASRYQIAKTFDPSKSYMRLLKADNLKVGGGYRVKEITIHDNWDVMTKENNVSQYSRNTYGSVYQYGKEVKGKIIPSGVAEYEPMLGGDENSFRRPIPYSGPKGLFGPSSPHYVEEPVCEGFFPSPSVGYSYVEVRSKNSSKDPKAISGTGKQIHEFYTSKEFPTYTERTNIGDNISRYSPNFFTSFLKIDNKTGLYLSQGNMVETNDMHGKSKSVKNYNQEGALISETITQYRFDQSNKNRQAINSKLPTISETGSIAEKVKGLSFDFYTDMRSQSTNIYQLDLELGGGFFLLGIFPIPHISPFPPLGVMENDFYSASTMKYIHKKAFIDKTYKMQDGSSVVTENVLWDDKTGDIVLTKTVNEFDDPVYSLKYPAYWKYKDMDFSFKNMSMYFSGKVTDGVIPSSPDPNIKPYLYQGDELVFIDSNKKSKSVWVLEDPASPSTKYFIDRNGYKLNDSGYFKIVRTGRRNMSTQPMFQVSTLDNPLASNGIQLDQTKRILSVSGNTYTDRWKIIKNAPFNKTDGCYDMTKEKQILETESNAILDDYRFKYKISDWLDCQINYPTNLSE